MIRLEQVCRYRKDQGYGISAKTSGITPAQVTALGEVFNDSMNTLFPKVGTSFLTCITGSGSAFYARTTLLTDSHGRISLHTHSYVLPEEAYGRLMTENPRGLLEIPMSDLLDTPVGSGSLPDVELKVYPPDEDHLSALMRKYDLTPERYANLLYGAYHAILNHWPLRLVTSRGFDQREQMVREIALCIQAGLLPNMRRLLTFSSGPDWRTCLSVVGTDTQLDQEDMIFGVEDDALTNIQITDFFRGSFFQAVASCSGQARTELLELIQLWLTSELEQEIPGSVMVVASAYAAEYGDKSPESRMFLFCGIKACAGQGIELDIANDMMIQILDELHLAGAVDLSLISHIADWYLRQSSDAYRAKADEILRRWSTPHAAVTLISAALKTKNTPNKAQLIHVLLETGPLGTRTWTDADQKKLFYWIISTDQADLLDLVEAIMPLFDGQYPQMLERLLREAEGKALNKTQIGLQLQVMNRVLKDKLELSETTCGYLDSHVAEFDAETDPDGKVCRQLARHLITMRLDQTQQMVFQARELLRHAKRSAHYRGILEQELLDQCDDAIITFRNRELIRGSDANARCLEELASGKSPWTTPCLRWEYYMAEKVMGQSPRAEEILQICSYHNNFKYGGYFEKRAVEILSAGALAQRRELTAQYPVPEELSSDDQKKQLKARRDQLLKWVKDWLEKTKNIKMSPKMLKEFQKVLIVAYWDAADLKEIFRCPQERNNLISKVTEDSGDARSIALLRLQTAFNSYRSNNQSLSKARNLRESVSNLCYAVAAMQRLAPETTEPIRHELERILTSNIRRGMDLPLDLVLVCCMDSDDKQSTKLLVQLLDRLQNMIDLESKHDPKRQNIRVVVEDSEFLNNNKLKRGLQRELASRTRTRPRPQLMDHLINDLKKPQF